MVAMLCLSVRYQETIVITHRDWSVLPAEADRRDINLYLPTLPPPSPPEDEAELWTGNSKPGPSTPSPFGRMPYFEPCHDAIYTMATHIIRPPPSLRRRGVEDVLQTTNPVISIDAEKVLGVAKMERSVHLRSILAV